LKCTFTSNKVPDTWTHVREIHGAKYFPWVCGCCKNGPTPTIKHWCFVKAETLYNHWKLCHKNILTAKELIHKEYGNDYTLFPYQTLKL